MKKLKAKFGMLVCDFGLWVLSLGPKDMEDRENAKKLREYWRTFKAQAGA